MRINLDLINIALYIIKSCKINENFKIVNYTKSDAKETKSNNEPNLYSKLTHSDNRTPSSKS